MVPKTLYRYRSLNQYSLCELIHSEFYFASPQEFNDPYDCKNMFSFEGTTDNDWRLFLNRFLEVNRPELTAKERKQQIDLVLQGGEHRSREKVAEQFDVWGKILEKQSSELGILCLSKTHTDILMWSHYANNHKGYCLEFDANKLRELFFCGEVVYKDNYPRFSEFVRANLNGIAQTFTLTKSKHWKYEQEYRLIVQPNGRQDKPGDRIFPYNPNALIGVIFGCQMSEKDKLTIRQILKDKPVVYKQARKSPHSYSIKLSDC
ncbi:DUF2971 domain-containing protein [Geomonas propionica]|uniref:DUF2971 domain-containing protein n=1 Tax=Geomonas propionica TaxID=2798582 RepID=A0ABS0YP29_9BACT|nr:DUF2971 domain-containing protein [Geomonas propionica]MBJ6799739.1 DUF2971 domain-containing protein [Geomonas propionica]